MKSTKSNKGALTPLKSGRWIEKVVYTWNAGTSSYQPSLTNRFLWDGQVLSAVLDHTNGVVMSFMRGLDLSGSVRAAGGVGGVLAVHFHSTPGLQGTTHLVTYDGNGNVAALLDASSSQLSAQFEYGPFGESIRVTGQAAHAMPLRFSTMYQDSVTGDLKYLFRDYDADTGRWRSRDPLEERSTPNLYSALHNVPESYIDPDGRQVVDPAKLVAPKCVSQIDPATFRADVAKCEIVVVYGHTLGRPWDFTFNNRCAAGGVVACQPGDSNSRIRQPIGGLEYHDRQCWWVPEDDSHNISELPKRNITADSLDGVNSDARRMLGSAIRGALSTAKEICEKGCCPHVLIRGAKAAYIGTGNSHLPSEFTIKWDCGRKVGRFWSDDREFVFDFHAL